MNFLVVIWIVVVIAISMAGKASTKQNKKSNSTYGRSSMNRSGSYGKSASGNAASTNRNAEYGSAGRRTRPSGSSRRQQESWHNEAEITAADITFRNLRPGTDELEVLIRHNTRYEKMLEARLVSREDQ